MAEAVLALCSQPSREISGQRVLSLHLLDELAIAVHALLDGCTPWRDDNRQ
jgi:hypothetical protein